MISDQELRAALHRLAPDVEEAGVWEALHHRVGRRPTRVPLLVSGEQVFAGHAKPSPPRRAPRTWRVIGFAAATAIVLVVAVFGVNALVERLTENKGIVMITNDAMSPAETGYSVSAAEGVYRLLYGQTANIDGLDITVTVRPTLVPFTESDPHPVGSLPTELDDWQLRSRLRSQYIITNTGSETQMVDLRRFVALGEDGNRYSLMAQTLELEPGDTLSGRLDFYVDSDVSASAVAYTTDHLTEDLAVWGPEAITEGPGYPVLQELPLLRAEEVESFEYEGWDEQGRPLPGQTITATENPAGIAALIELYGQTKLDPAQGYPNYTTPVHLTLHLKDGTDFSIWIEAPDSDLCIIQDTRATTDGNPPAATGTNPALVRAFYGLDGAYGEGGWALNSSSTAVGDWPVNARGQTYGSNASVGPEGNEPDLILVEATNGRTGYVLKTDLNGPMPKTPEEALAWQEARKGQPPREIPVYLSDGVTQIGVFLVGP